MKPDRYTASTTIRAMQTWKELKPYNTTPKKLCIDCSSFTHCPTYSEIHPYAIACLLFHTSGKIVTVSTPFKHGDLYSRLTPPIKPTAMPSSGTKVTR